MSQRDHERDRDIVERRLTGETLASIGADYGISRERVRQIVEREGVTREESLRAVREAKAIEWTCEGCGKVERRWRAHKKSMDYCSMRCFHDHGNRGRKWTADDLLLHLAMLALDLGHTPSEREIQAVSPPSYTQYYRDFGSLRAAHERLGLVPNKRGENHGCNPLTAAFIDEWGDLLDRERAP